MDSARKEALAGATVSILLPKDSSLVASSLTQEGGEFAISNLPAGFYQLWVSFQGYTTLKKNFIISAEYPNINLNTLYLDRAGTLLQTVVVEGPPIQVKKDTVEFRASAFAAKPNAYAEDVPKKMPGVQVDKDGNIKAQGEDVQKVYVDGKEFFGTDPKLATKNITADMIESIQVYDDMSD
ncbi:MAG: carboxypeptidase-like regulatory domain-containing protein, partial [Microcystis sp.]